MICANCGSVAQAHGNTAYYDCSTCRHKVYDSLTSKLLNHASCIIHRKIRKTPNYPCAHIACGTVCLEMKITSYFPILMFYGRFLYAEVNNYDINVTSCGLLASSFLMPLIRMFLVGKIKVGVQLYTLKLIERLRGATIGSDHKKVLWVLQPRENR